jgi:hypothetical protein
MEARDRHELVIVPGRAAVAVSRRMPGALRDHGADIRVSLIMAARLPERSIRILKCLRMALTSCDARLYILIVGWFIA